MADGASMRPRLFWPRKGQDALDGRNGQTGFNEAAAVLAAEVEGHLSMLMLDLSASMRPRLFWPRKCWSNFTVIF